MVEGGEREGNRGEWGGGRGGGDGCGKSFPCDRELALVEEEEEDVSAVQLY